MPPSGRTRGIDPASLLGAALVPDATKALEECREAVCSAHLGLEGLHERAPGLRLQVVVLQLLRQLLHLALGLQVRAHTRQRRVSKCYPHLGSLAMWTLLQALHPDPSSLRPTAKALLQATSMLAYAPGYIGHMQYRSDHVVSEPEFKEDA